MTGADARRAMPRDLSLSARGRGYIYAFPSLDASRRPARRPPAEVLPVPRAGRAARGLSSGDSVWSVWGLCVCVCFRLFTVR
jgi:hypothetical protein